ncbi:MAG: colicin V production CvpA [Sedimenticola sp.]|jgi:membrane protein required for colicin V production|nr:MAG: colicin V production CvpA [Sedimenticola sp.]
MIWIDYVILGIIGLSALISLIRGFMREALSLAAWVLAFWVAWTFFRDLAIHLDWFTMPSLQLAASFGLLFIATLMVGALVNFLVGQLVDKTGLTGTDRLVGMLFGAARGAILVAILVLLAGLTPFPNDPWWQSSQLIGYFQDLAVWLKQLLPADIGEKFNFV